MSNNEELVVTHCMSGSNASGTAVIVSARRMGKILQQLFVNVGDSTTRWCAEHAVKLSNVRGVLLTSLAPQHVSGLPGLLLSLSTLGVGSLLIAGPAGLQGMLDSMEVFTNRRYPEVEVREFTVLDTVETAIELGKFKVGVQTMASVDQVQQLLLIIFV